MTLLEMMSFAGWLEVVVKLGDRSGECHLYLDGTYSATGDVHDHDAVMAKISVSDSSGAVRSRYEALVPLEGGRWIDAVAHPILS